MTLNIKTDYVILQRMRKNGPPVEIRIEYDEHHKEWEVNLRNRDPKQMIGDWFIWGTGKTFSLNDAIHLAFNEAEKRGYYGAAKDSDGKWCVRSEKNV